MPICGILEFKLGCQRAIILGGLVIMLGYGLFYISSSIFLDFFSIFLFGIGLSILFSFLLKLFQVTSFCFQLLTLFPLLSTQLFASKYKLYLPTEDELRAEIENQKTIFELQKQNKKELDND